MLKAGRDTIVGAIRMERPKRESRFGAAKSLESIPRL